MGFKSTNTPFTGERERGVGVVGCRQRPTLPQGKPCSTIGPGGLNDRVRDGIGWGPSGRTTGGSAESKEGSVLVVGLVGCVQPRGGKRGRGVGDKPIGRLVSLGCSHCCVCTCDLSTLWSSTGLMGSRHLERGFPLRCVQWLSVPNVATRRCLWRDNRYTSGSSIPVLSY